MKIGVVYPQTELEGDPIAVKEIGLATEDLGYDHLLAYDHVVGAIHEDREPELWGPIRMKTHFTALSPCLAILRDHTEDRVCYWRNYSASEANSTGSEANDRYRLTFR